MLFILSEYWPFVLAAAVLGIAVGWWLASPAGGGRRTVRSREDLG